MISIIVPIYNVEKYLSRCIESIIKQTYKDLEIILIDDGSPDNCPKICDEYAEKDSRIIVIHQENKGVSAARNAGLDIAKGEYIGFVDPDDFVVDNMYEELYHAITHFKYDLAICGYDYVDDNGVINRKYQDKDDEEFDQKDLVKAFFDMPPTIRLCVWNKLFKKSIINSLRFTIGIKGAEDAEFLGKYLIKINSAVYVHKALYKNVERNGSATRGGLKNDSVIPALNIYNRVRKYFSKKYPDTARHAQAYYLDACLLAYNVHCRNDKAGTGLIIRKLRKRVFGEFPNAFFNSEIYWKTRISYYLFALGLRY